jgi:hypothetical protein
VTKVQATALRKVSIANLRTGETLDAQYNPTDFEEKISVNWQRLAVPGMSHKVLQYQGTENHGFSFDFYSRGFTNAEAMALRDWRNFLASLCYPSEGASSIRDGAPPRVLVVWPTLLSMTCVIGSVVFRNQSFGADLRLTRMVASVDFEEIRDVRLTSEEVRLRGSRRASAGGDSGGESST